jgi:predicted glycosyltransferase
MKIFFDLYHSPQYNFFKNTIQKLGPEVVELGCVKRGKLVDIIKHECPDFNLHIIGNYKYNYGPVTMGGIIIVPRVMELLKIFKANRFDVVGTAHYQSNLAAKIMGIPNFSILDDPRFGVIQVVQACANEFYLPPFSRGFENVKKFNALKEWAYLSPQYFKPNRDVLEEYRLKEKKYIFIREVFTNTSNYLSQEKNLVLKLAGLFQEDVRVILSLEKKSLKEQFPNHWTVLEEPVSDVHSLMYYSKLVISSGDSMAREGGMLGVPSIYIGNRDMPANRILIEKGILFKKSPKELSDIIELIEQGKINLPDQVQFREELLNSWIDVNDFVMEIINRLQKS